MINAPVEVVKNQKIVVDQIQNIINQFKNQKKIMENLIIYLAIGLIVALIIMLASAYKGKNLWKSNFDKKVKELDAKDSTINTQKAELANRKDQIDAQRKLITKATEDLELVKAGLESCREDFNEKDRLLKNYQTESKRQTDAIIELNKEIIQAKEKITTLEEENQELLTKLNSKPNGKRNPKN